MIFKYLYLLKTIFVISYFFIVSAYAEIVKSIKIIGNERISNETIQMFADVSVEDNLNPADLNNILKKVAFLRNLYYQRLFQQPSLF